jgi:hypothetical protein
MNILLEELSNCQLFSEDPAPFNQLNLSEIGLCLVIAPCPDPGRVWKLTAKIL